MADANKNIEDIINSFKKSHEHQQKKFWKNLKKIKETFKLKDDQINYLLMRLEKCQLNASTDQQTGSHPPESAEVKDEIEKADQYFLLFKDKIKEDKIKEDKGQIFEYHFNQSQKEYCNKIIKDVGIRSVILYVECAAKVTKIAESLTTKGFQIAEHLKGFHSLNNDIGKSKEALIKDIEEIIEKEKNEVIELSIDPPESAEGKEKIEKADKIYFLLIKYKEDKIKDGKIYEYRFSQGRKEYCDKIIKDLGNPSVIFYKKCTKVTKIAESLKGKGFHSSYNDIGLNGKSEEELIEEIEEII